MDKVDLPLLDADDTVEEAINRMNAFDRRFVIVRFSQNAYRSFNNKEVLGGWAQGCITLSNLQGGRAVANVQLASFATVSQIMSLPYDHPQRERVRDVLDSSGSDFGVSGSLPMTGKAEVFTRQESIANAARSTTKECICSFDNTHNGRCPPNPSDGKCPLCHRNTWRCA